MSDDTEAASDAETEDPLTDADLGCIDPSKIRVVDIERKDTGEILRRDCYDPDGGAAEIGDVMGLKRGELWLRTVSWARSKSMEPTIHVRWEATGLAREDIGKVEVFAWPVGEPVPIFTDNM